MIPVVYVAGPFRGKDHYAIHKNVERAEALSHEVWAIGAAAICPHTMTQHFQDSLPDEVWLKGDIELLRRCDALVLVEGYERSSGTKAEVAYALDHNIPVFFSVEELAQWMMEKGTYREYVR